MKEKFPDTYRFVIGTDPIQVPFDDQEFDGVVSVGVLQSTRNTGGEGRSLFEFRRILRDKGKFICYHLPNKYSLKEYFLRVNHHQYTYTGKDIDTFAAQSGFKILKIKKYQLLPRMIFKKYNKIGQLKMAYRGVPYIDNVLSAIFNPLCEFWAVVLEKR